MSFSVGWPKDHHSALFRGERRGAAWGLVALYVTKHVGKVQYSTVLDAKRSCLSGDLTMCYRAYLQICALWWWLPGVKVTKREEVLAPCFCASLLRP